MNLPLYEQIANWLHSGKPAPSSLIDTYERALMEYQKGGDFMEIMGLNYFEKSHGTPEKRKKYSKEVTIKANLKHVLDDLSDLGKLSEPQAIAGLNKFTEKNTGLGNLTESERQKLYGIGLPKVIPQGGAKILTEPAIRVLIDYLKMRGIKSMPDKNYLEFITAYEAAALIFYDDTKSEGKIRKLLK